MVDTQSGATGLRNLVTVVSVCILVGVEVFAVALAAGWATAGMFQLGNTVAYALMALFSALGAYLMLLFVRQTLSVEPIRR